MKKILTHVTTWMKFEDIILSEIRQPQKGKYYMITLTWGSQRSETHKNRVEWWSPEAGGRGEWRVL